MFANVMSGQHPLLGLEPGNQSLETKVGTAQGGLVKKAWMPAAATEDRIFLMGGAYKLDNAEGFAWLDDVHEFIM